MANEAKVFTEGPDNCIVRTFTVAVGTAIPKGTMMVESADRTAIAMSGAALPLHAPLGPATSSKTDTTDTTTIGCQRTGVATFYVDGAYQTGGIAILGTTSNRVRQLFDLGTSKYEIMTSVVGRFLESGTDGTTARVALTLG